MGILLRYYVYHLGNLVSDSKQGFGLIKFSSGEVFEGEFVNDKMEGKGKFHKKDGTIINGLWRGSKFILKLWYINNKFILLLIY